MQTVFMKMAAAQQDIVIQDIPENVDTTFYINIVNSANMQV